MPAKGYPICIQAHKPLTYTPSMLNVKTKKYQLPVKTFVRIGMLNIIRDKQLRYVFLVPIALILPGLYFTGALGWLIFSAVMLTVLYLLFWGIQFYGITQVPAGKPLFEKLFYELDNKFLLIKKTPQEGMQMTWDQIKRVEKTDDAYIFYISKVQFIHLPFTIFGSETEMRFTDNLLRRKKLLPGQAEAEEKPLIAAQLTPEQNRAAKKLAAEAQSAAAKAAAAKGKQ